MPIDKEGGINSISPEEWDSVSRQGRVQVGGKHYLKHKIQPWDIVTEFCLNFWEGNVIKYVLRNKGDRLEDLYKARHYLDKQIELIETAQREKQNG